MPQCGFQFESGIIAAVGSGPTQKAAEQQAGTIAAQLAHDAAKAWLKKQQPCPKACPIEQSAATARRGLRHRRLIGRLGVTLLRIGWRR